MSVDSTVIAVSALQEEGLGQGGACQLVGGKGADALIETVRNVRMRV